MWKLNEFKNFVGVIQSIPLQVMLFPLVSLGFKFDDELLLLLLFPFAKSGPAIFFFLWLLSCEFCFSVFPSELDASLKWKKTQRSKFILVEETMNEQKTATKIWLANWLNHIWQKANLKEQGRCLDTSYMLVYIHFVRKEIDEIYGWWRGGEK